MKVKESTAVNNPTDGPPSAAKLGRLQGAIKSINVRKEPDINSPAKFILRAGIPFRFSEVPGNPDWYVIEGVNDVGAAVGYAMSKYITEVTGGSA